MATSQDKASLTRVNTALRYESSEVSEFQLIVHHLCRLQAPSQSGTLINHKHLHSWHLTFTPILSDLYKCFKAFIGKYTLKVLDESNMNKNRT